MKKILLALTVCACLCACLSNKEQKMPEQISIEAVYSVDTRICSTSKSISEIVMKLQGVNLNGCPSDFVDAYRSNIRAWRKLSDVTQKMYASDMKKANSDIESFISEYRSNPTAATVELKKQWPAFAKEIDTACTGIIQSVAEYTAIGAKYNAVYSKSGSFFD